ncbi:MAG TPA: ferritin-like domain-containing protein [Candidatus Binatia bacterium]|nr:ferritin-like domain-containing protein [Candidatus Binatia bacterium]
MNTTDRYALPPGDSSWSLPEAFETTFRWEYQDGRDSLLKLYAKGKQRQWDATERIDWSQDLDPENPEQLPDESIPLFGSDVFARLTPPEKANLRRHFQSWQLSQFLHGEQGALICTAKIVQQVPSIDAKFYAATQVIDEARHVEAYSRLLHDKFELAYPITPTLRRLLDSVLRDSRWDMTYLGMQVLIEGLALAAFAQIRDQSQNPLAASVNAYVMQDEARHVAFGRFALRDYYPQLTQAERDEREEFAVEACYLMRDRFQAEEVWETLGLPVDECAAYMLESGFMQNYRSALFSRIVPIIKDIGLWGPKIRAGYQAMNILGYAGTDVEAMQANDEQVAVEFDARRAEVDRVAEAGGAANGDGAARSTDRARDASA